MLDFLNEPNPFSVYSNVESPKVTKFSLPLGEIDLDGTGLYVGNNGTVQAENNLPDLLSSRFIVNNTEEHTPINNSNNMEEKKTYKVSQNLSNNLKKAYDFFISKGLLPYHAAGIIGNLIGESNLNPEAINPSSKAFGIALWLGDRKKKLIAKYGKNPTFELQLDFLWDELNSSEKTAFNKLLLTQSTKEATNSFMLHFERPSKQEMEQSITKRIKYAESLLS